MGPGPDGGGYQVHAVNPLQAARYRERLTVSGAKSDTTDAHMLADMVRTDSHQLRAVAGDSELADAVKVVTRAHKTLIWERARHTLRLRHALLEFFPAALAAFDDLTAPDALELLAKAPGPASAARLSIVQITAALKRARRHHRDTKAAAIQAALRTEHLSQPAVSRLEAARGLATPLLVVVKIGLALAGELRKLDPSILDPELRRALESPEPFGPLLGVLRPDAMPVTADPDLEALVRLYRRTPERQRQGVLAIMAAAIDGL